MQSVDLLCNTTNRIVGLLGATRLFDGSLRDVLDHQGRALGTINDVTQRILGIAAQGEPVLDSQPRET